MELNTDFISNSGHSNIDNAGELYSQGTFMEYYSLRFMYSNKWLSLDIEPYHKINKDFFDNSYSLGTYQANNNHIYNKTYEGRKIGLKDSKIIIHYNGFGIGYGNMHHWWGPGFHSSIVLSPNAPSQETYLLGTIKDIKIGNFSFGSQIIAMPYKSSSNEQLYFSGLKTYLSHHSNSMKITAGIHRTYLSGDFPTGNISSWSLLDAASLVIEPLFGQNKKDLDYTIPGTPGFDIWDEILSGYIKLVFPKINLEFYTEIASDDNRGNFTDLLAHWDHTLGYMIGFKKYAKINKLKMFYGLEYLSTKVSNTFNPNFYRGNEPDNFYAKPMYDFFTYEGRRLGAHSGSSSDDLVFIYGLDNGRNILFFSYNKERHGIKSKVYPELKSEVSLTFYHNFNKSHRAFMTIEYEKIDNFGFFENNISISKLIWFGYSFSFNLEN